MGWPEQHSSKVNTSPVISPDNELGICRVCFPVRNFLVEIQLISTVRDFFPCFCNISTKDKRFFVRFIHLLHQTPKANIISLNVIFCGAFVCDRLTVQTFFTKMQDFSNMTSKYFFLEEYANHKYLDLFQKKIYIFICNSIYLMKKVYIPFIKPTPPGKLNR